MRSGVISLLCFTINIFSPEPEINIKTTNCIDELSRISKNTSENKNVDDLFNCLKKYGDIYKKLGVSESDMKELTDLSKTIMTSKQK